MCGIFTLLNFQKDIKLSFERREDVFNTISYRGRDGRGFWNDNNVELLHTRLAILDLDKGLQPMHDNSNRYVIVFNGEIYNYKELKKEYEISGAKFTTNSDTEVILEGFKLKKEKVLQDLNGMFAFTIWDKKEKRLFVARDRLGKKPLFWCKQDGGFIFASSINSLKLFKKVNLNPNYIEQVKTIGASVDNSTIYKDIFSCGVASYAYIDKKCKIELKKYWNLSFNKNERLKLNYRLEEYEYLLTDAIKIRLRADVPLCLTFSGGVDSGTIAAIIVKKLQEDIKLFCIDYHTDSDQSLETIQAQKVAKKLSLKLNHIHYDYKENIFSDLLKAYKNFDQPCMQLPLVYSDILYRNVKDFAKVTLAGNGADELFTGYIGDENNYFKNNIYRWFHPIAKLLPFNFVPNVLKKGVVSNYVKNQQCIINDASEANHFLKNMLNSEIYDLYDLQMYISLFYGARDSNFVLPDITGLSNQVEVRSPFLDYRLVEFAAKTPVELKIKKHFFQQTLTKYLPKLYYEKFVGKDLAYAKKKGMGYNFNWALRIVNDPICYQQFLQSLNDLQLYGIDSLSYISAFNNYSDDIKVKKKIFSNYASEVMTGFMISNWLKFQSNKIYPL